MIPCYNHAALLGPTLESVLAQSPGVEEMQIEVVDDASTLDDPAEVVKRIGGGRVGIYRQPSNLGASANFTSCVRRARGRWVHVLHSDDMVLPGFYEAYRERIEACPDVIMVGGRTTMIDRDGQRLSVTDDVEVMAGHVCRAAFTVATANPVQFVSAVVARSAYEALGGFHPELFHTNDWEMWARVAAHGPVGWVDEPFGLYRIHDGSDSRRLHSSTAYLDDCLHATTLISEQFDSLGERKIVRRLASRRVAHYALDVCDDLLRSGQWRLAATNAVRAAVIDCSPEVRARAWHALGGALSGRLGLRRGADPLSGRDLLTTGGRTAW